MTDDELAALATTFAGSMMGVYAIGLLARAGLVEMDEVKEVIDQIPLLFAQQFPPGVFQQSLESACTVLLGQIEALAKGTGPGAG